MKLVFSDKRDHDLRTDSKRLKDLRGNFDRMKKTISSGIYVLLTADFFFSMEPRRTNMLENKRSV